jgi:hypothetical protein
MASGTRPSPRLPLFKPENARHCRIAVVTQIYIHALVRKSIRTETGTCSTLAKMESRADLVIGSADYALYGCQAQVSPMAHMSSLFSCASTCIVGTDAH